MTSVRIVDGVAVTRVEPGEGHRLQPAQRGEVRRHVLHHDGGATHDVISGEQHLSPPVTEVVFGVTGCVQRSRRRTLAIPCHLLPAGCRVRTQGRVRDRRRGLPTRPPAGSPWGHGRDGYASPGRQPGSGSPWPHGWPPVGCDHRSRVEDEAKVLIDHDPGVRPRPRIRAGVRGQECAQPSSRGLVSGLAGEDETPDGPFPNRAGVHGHHLAPLGVIDQSRGVLL